MKLNIGAGTDIREGWINHDIASLPGISVVHNLNVYPWPFEDQSFDTVLVKDVLEHLDDFLKAINEIYRITKPGAKIYVEVPYWNSWCQHTDPTHKKSFTEDTFRFFDPREELCQDRPYYTKARFLIEEESFVITPLLPQFRIPKMGYFEIRRPWAKKILSIFAGFLNNIIQDLKYTLVRDK